jgi:hypothetical protein
MANDITTVLTITGDDATLDAIEAKHVVMGENGRPCFDFETLVPRPACVAETEAGSEADIGLYALTGLFHARFYWARHPMTMYVDRGFKPEATTSHEDFAEWLREHFPTVIAKGEKAFRCLRETGSKDWYDWSYANWGTKWNAYDYARRERVPGRLVIAFDTANGVATPILRKLSETYPSVSIAVEAVDEGGWEYAGAFVAGVGAVAEQKDREGALYERVMQRKPHRDEEEDDVQPAVQ